MLVEISMCDTPGWEEADVLWVLRSVLNVRNQEWRRRPFGHHQSSGRQFMKAWSALAWSSDGMAQQMWLNSLKCWSRIVLVTRHWLVRLRLSGLRHGLCRVCVLRNICITQNQPLSPLRSTDIRHQWLRHEVTLLKITVSIRILQSVKMHGSHQIVHKYDSSTELRWAAANCGTQTR